MKYNVNDLFYLCNHLDIYPSFRIDIERLLNKASLKNLISKTVKESNKDFDIKDTKVKKFCKKYNILADMIVCSATCDEVRTKVKKIDNIYEYITNNIDKLDNIKAILKKLDKLGFRNIIFDSNMNLVSDKYSISLDATKNKSIVYLDNIKVLPFADLDIINYKSNNSNYKIEIIYLSRYDNMVLLRGSNIYLNSLTFSPDRLPEDLSLKNTFNKIIELAQNQVKLRELVQNLAYIDYGIDQVIEALNNLEKYIEKLSNVDDKETLKDNLTMVRSILTNMAAGQNLDESISRDALIKKRELYKSRINL